MFRGKTHGTGKRIPPQGGSGTSKPKKRLMGASMATNKASFTRPADTTAYASGDLVANSVTNTLVVPMTLHAGKGAGVFSGCVRRARVKKTGTSITTASFRIHLYAGPTAPTVTNGDNAAWLSNLFDKYLGALDVVVDKAMSDGAAGTGAPLNGQEVNFTLQAGEKIYGLLEARSAYTPISGEIFTVELETSQ